MARRYSQNTQAAAEAQSRVAEEERKKARLFKQIEYGVSGLLVLIGVISIISGFLAKASSSSQVEDLRSQIEAAQQVLEQKQAEQSEQGGDTVGTVMYVDAVVNSAAVKGQEVCTMQNTLSGYTNQLRVSGSRYLTTEHQQLLVEFSDYFVNISSSILGTWCEFGTWTFDSVYDYEGVSAQVAWRCFDDDHNLMAFCIATYNGDMKKFQEAKLYRTLNYTEAVEEAPPIMTGDVTSSPEVTTSSTMSESTTPPVIIDVPIIDDPIIVPDVTTSESYIEPDYTMTQEPDVVLIPSETEATTPVPEIVYPEEDWYYGWSMAYQCWGYFNKRDGRFLTIEEYQMEMGW